MYQEIDKLRRCKDFYASDMTNIEEILSLFEMGKMLGAEAKKQIDFQKFIAAVVNFYTPSKNECLGNSFLYLNKFIHNLFRIEKFMPFNSVCYNRELPFYSILTFNYDMLLENTLEKYKAEYYEYQMAGINFSPKKEKNDDLIYIKLHGSSDQADSIVTPTWRKTFDNDNDNKWSVAGEILSKANHIRIIGYSLPVTDSYLKYFLKWGAAHEQNLKSIDVICLDDEQHSVENRYREFIHHKLNFYNKATKDYLMAVSKGIEKAHQNLFQEK